jgi:hypothetical protein
MRSERMAAALDRAPVGRFGGRMLRSPPLDDRAFFGGFDTADPAELEAAWALLAPFGIHAVPYLVDAYHSATTWQGRAAALHYATRFARDSEAAFLLGLEALDDRSRTVRARACGLLAYSLRHEAEDPLLVLARHLDAATREHAQAALAAIREQNHHLFKDRIRSGLVFWIVNQSDLPDI